MKKLKFSGYQTKTEMKKKK